jgi:tetrahydromethanopterin S-methyltransferase subunit B
MGIISLYAENKNQFRKYPVKQGMPFQAEDGTVVSDDLIVNCTITTLYGKHRLYIRQIYHAGVSARITIASVFDDVVLGMFYGDVTEDFTTLPFIPFVRNISGSLTIGAAKSLTSIVNTLHFTKDAAELEESAIFCYVPPAVTSVSDKKNTQLRGDVNFGVLTNLKKSNTVAKTTQFTVTNPASVFNLADKSTYLDNCPNPIIKNIDGVEPYPMGNALPGNDGNIYIVGVKPVAFYGIPAGIIVGSLITGTNIAANTFITAGSDSSWTVSVNQTTNTNVAAKVYRSVWLGSVYITGTTLKINTLTAGLALGQLITGPGIAANTVITAGSGNTWTVSVSQNVGTLAAPVAATAYEQTWQGTVSTVNGTKALQIISTTPGSATVGGVPGSLKIQTTGVTLDSLCTLKHKLLPPVDICGFTDPLFPDKYYSKLALGATGASVCSGRPARNDNSYYNTTRAEYYFWPQFVKPTYYTSYWNTLS